MVLRLALGIALWLCSAQAFAQLAAPAQEPASFREQMRRGSLLLELGDVASAEAAYIAAYRVWPSAEAQWALGRVACARSNFGDCTAWVRAALDAMMVPLSAEQRETALSLLHVAEEAQERAFKPHQTATVVVLSPGAAADQALLPEEQGVEVETHAANRATLWTVASMVVVAALAGVLVGLSAQSGR